MIAVVYINEMNQWANRISYVIDETENHGSFLCVYMWPSSGRFILTGLVRTGESASEDGVRIQAEHTRRNIGIVVIRENIESREGSAAAKFFRRSMLV